MANCFLQTLVCLLSLAALAAARPTSSFKLDLQAGNNLGAGEYIYQGDAYYIPSTPARIRLTGDNTLGPSPNSVGRVVWSEPIQFSSNGQQLSFESVLRFLVTPVDSRPAEGLTFFIAPVGTQIPQNSANGNLGVFGAQGSSPNVLAIEFDSNNNPGLSEPMIPHVGIDIRSPISSNVTNLGSAMIAQEVTATIRYDHAPRLITVTVSTGNQVFEVSYVTDLSTVLHPQAQIGISAATGENVAFHDVFFWEFRQIGYVPISSGTQVV